LGVRQLISVIGKSFSGDYQHLSDNSPHSLSPSLLDLGLASIRVGYSSYSQALGSGGILRACALVADIFGFISPNLTATPYLLNLEQSERAVKISQLSNALTMYASEVLLSIPSLIHFSFLQPSSIAKAPTPYVKGSNTMQVGANRRPDFIGRDMNGAYHIVEVKGTGGSIDNGMRNNAIEQVSVIQTINQEVPVTRVASLFSLTAASIDGEFIDPEGDEEGLTAKLNFQEYMTAAYPLFTANRNFLSINSDIRPDYVFLELNEHIAFGLHKEVYSLMEVTSTRAGFERLSRAYFNIANQQLDAGRDAINIAAGFDGTILIIGRRESSSIDWR
jgi:hypothetical protein